MTNTARTAVIIGAGPGLGMSMARTFGREGYRIALISRSDTRHGDYLTDLSARGIEATAHTADATDPDQLGAALTEIAATGAIEFVYYGPAAGHPTPITEVDVPTARAGFDLLWPVIEVVRMVLPGMLERGAGGLIIAGGLSSVRPMPMLGQLALVGAALRNYALTLHAALSEQGLYAGTLTIGGLIERGDIHATIAADPANYAAAQGHTLNPDEIADTAWQMYRTRDRAETVFDVLGD